VRSCANPACRKKLPDPLEGQAVELEIISVSVAASDEARDNYWDESPRKEAMRVYLCSECAKNVSIQIGEDGITVRPN
jgi:hypothetical protein